MKKLIKIGSIKKHKNSMISCLQIVPNHIFDIDMMLFYFSNLNFPNFSFPNFQFLLQLPIAAREELASHLETQSPKIEELGKLKLGKLAK